MSEGIRAARAAELTGLSLRSEGFVYVIQAKEGTPVKIGFSMYDPWGRCRDLQTGNPYPLRVIAQVQGSFAAEKRIHELLDAERLSGEWFEMTDRTHALVERLTWGWPIEEAIEALAGLPPVAAEDGLNAYEVVESSTDPLFNLMGNVVRMARTAGDGPPIFRTDQQKSHLHRFYRVGDVKTWLDSKSIRYRFNRPVWTRLTSPIIATAETTT